MWKMNTSASRNVQAGFNNMQLHQVYLNIEKSTPLSYQTPNACPTEIGIVCWDNKEHTFKLHYVNESGVFIVQ